MRWVGIGWLIGLLWGTVWGQAVPRSVEAIPRGPTRITLYWLPPQGETPIGYRVFLDGQPVRELPSQARAYDFERLEPARPYRLAVQALYPDGQASERVERIERPFRTLPSEVRYPLVIVGGTASGVGAAITAARLGIRVALLEETNRLGGMISNGVAITDVRVPSRINGLFEEFRQKVEAYYRAQGADTSHYIYRNGLNYEPWVANMLLKEMVYAEPDIDVYFGVYPVRVFKHGNRVVGVEVQSVLDGTRGRFYADVVIDATVEADVAAWAGAKWRIGREPRSEEEPHAGVIYYDRLNDRLLLGSTGEGDKRIQAYALMLAVQNYPTDQVRTPPPGYDPRHYLLAPPWERSWAYLYGRFPPNKFEINQHPHGSDLQEENYRYPIARYAERRRIYERYKQHALGYLHYIQTVQGQRNLWLAEDEYRDNEHVPPILYVREARRVEGEVLLKEMDIIRARERVRPDAVAIGDYPMDSHAVRKVQVPEGKSADEVPHMGEGEYWLFPYTPWYQVPYGVIVPKGVEGLLVSSAVSATHVAYGTLRMEPVRMTLGQAAGAAAALSLQTGIPPRKLPIEMIQRTLLRFGVYLYWFPDVNRQTEHFEAIQFLAARGYFPGERFEPEQPLTRGEAARLLWHQLRQLKPELKEERFQGLAFTDVLFGHPYAVAVQNLFLLGVIERTENRRFEPDRPITRREFARWLVRAMGVVDAEGWQPLTVVAMPYLDVGADDPDAPFILRLHARRIGSLLWDGLEAAFPEGIRYQPDAPLSRADAAVSLYFAYRVSK
jgi:hypothetical protein